MNKKFQTSDRIRANLIQFGCFFIDWCATNRSPQKSTVSDISMACRCTEIGFVVSFCFCVLSHYQVFLNRDSDSDIRTPHQQHERKGNALSDYFGGSAETASHKRGFFSLRRIRFVILFQSKSRLKCSMIDAWFTVRVQLGVTKPKQKSQTVICLAKADKKKIVIYFGIYFPSHRSHICIWWNVPHIHSTLHTNLDAKLRWRADHL